MKKKKFHFHDHDVANICNTRRASCRLQQQHCNEIKKKKMFSLSLIWNDIDRKSYDIIFISF